MAHLTEDTTRLAAEINGHRMDRSRLIRDMRNATEELKRGVAQTMLHFHTARLVQARDQEKRLRRFAANLSESVTAMRAAFADDLAGAHAAWFGGPKLGTRTRGERGHERAHAKA